MARQALHMNLRWPQFARTGGAESSTWRGELRPTEESRSYQVAISHSLGGIPKVRVLQSQIDPLAPHLYSDGTLCLYWPREWRWHDHRLLAETIVPWTANWLYFYELWQITGEWLGPSAPHAPRGKEQGQR